MSAFHHSRHESVRLPRRHLSAPLLLGILVLPAVFFWLLLRRGYANSLRVGAFIYLALCVATGLFAGFSNR
jgi:hypothetical protein